jgi:[ribosomal protein S5]-alanine N-acetyltransferase
MLTADLETPRLVLSCLDSAHVTDAYREWMSDPEVTRFLETRFSTPTLDSLRSYVSEMQGSANQYLFGMFERASGTHIGNIKLGPVSPVHQRAAIGLIIGDRPSWGQGFATEAIAAITRWGFVDLGLEKLSAGSYQSNRGSIAAFLRNNYLVEGVQRSHVQLADGGRDDVVVLGQTRADFLERGE